MKKYISNGRDYVLFLTVDGKPYTVRFRDMGAYENCGVFVTNDKSVAEALEHHPRFGDYFHLAEGEIKDEKDEPIKVHQFDASYPFVKRTQEAIKMLVTKHGVKSGTLNNKADVIAKAEELNISFPNLG